MALLKLCSKPEIGSLLQHPSRAQRTTEDTHCASYFCITVTDVPDINNLREEGFILIHGFRWFSPKLLGPMHLVTGACDRGPSSPHCGQEALKEGLQEWDRATESPTELPQ
jgi:hypothetical protein